MNKTFEILGISGKDYKFKDVKITIYLDPIDHSKQIRLLIRVVFEPQVDFSNPIRIYIQSNREIRIKNGEVINKSKKIKSTKYRERIGALELVEKAIPLKMKLPIVHIIGEDNRITIEIKPKKVMDICLERIREEKKKIKDTSKTEFGFMIDTVILNEGIEEEPIWKNLLGLSQFAWKFHFKVWSMIEDLEPIEPIFSSTTESVQMFLVIPKALIKSHGQIVAHPGEESMHIMTMRDINTFVISEKEKEKEKWRKRVESWVEKGSMAISWKHGETGSMSREAIVEHEQANPRAWTFLTFIFLLLILGVGSFPQVISPPTEEQPSLPTEEQPYLVRDMLIILLVLGYLILNMYNFSFYELKRKTLTKFLMDFSIILMGSLVTIVISIPVIPIIRQFIGEIPEKSSIIIFVIIIIVVPVLSTMKEYREIRRGNIKIKEKEKFTYLPLRIGVQITAIAIAVFTCRYILHFEIDMLLFFSYVYATVVGIPSSGSLIKRGFISDLGPDAV